MLSHMTISNFAIVKTLEFELKSGMTTITGETGAGKSIAIDALGLCLGDRTEASMVRPNEDKADISATFSLNNNQSARRWLEDNELIDGEECILRRVITKEGRSRGLSMAALFLSRCKNRSGNCLLIFTDSMRISN